MTIIKKMAGESEQMLINLNSPEKANNTPCQQTYLKNPLIPGPDVNCNIECNNPFDVVANSAENWDPFELVLHESLKKVENARNKTPSLKLDKSSKVFKSSTPLQKTNIIDVFQGSPRKIFRSHSVTENIKYFRSSIAEPSKSDTDSPPQSPEGSLSPNCSLTERIKKVVKRRVSKCIERALNGSVSQPDLSKADSPSPIKSYNNTLSKMAGVRSELPFLHNLVSSNSCYQYKRMPASSRHSKSFSAGDYTKEELTDIFQEAKNISITLQSMSISKSPKKEASLATEYKPRNVMEEDLMSVKPPWEENSDVSISSESDDSSIGLPKVKLYYLKKKEKKRHEISAADLAQYKRRIRASIDGNISCDEELHTTKINEPEVKPAEISNIALSESLMEEKNKIKEKDKETKDKLSVNIPVLPEVNDLRPKKRGNILKKGPLKAIVPLQKMTKTIAGKISPMRRNTLTNNSKNLNKSKEENSFSASVLQPVASSTPNRRGLPNAETQETVSKTRPRLSRQDNQSESKAKVNTFRRSLSSDSKTSNSKLPFSSVNPNVKQNKGSYLNRPHTAPSKTNSFAKNSPISKDSPRRFVYKMAANDKENRLQAV